VTDLAGKRIGAGGFGTLPAYEVRVLIDRYRLGPSTIIVPLNSSTDRMIGTQKGTIDAGIVPAPLDLRAEELGLKRLLHMGTILPIPQAGLATTDEKLKTGRGEVIEVLKATIEGLDYTWTQARGNRRYHRQMDEPQCSAGGEGLRFGEGNFLKKRGSFRRAGEGVHRYA
jgi:ABC-type nitrate/sulfonate/bicarbonate transport system substrate-binding protein